MKTFEEICEQLKGIDETTLLEVLNISSEDLVDRFQDLIELRLKFFQKDLEEDDSNT